MTHPLIDRLTTEFGWPRLTDSEALQAFVSAPGEHVLFVPGDPARNLETADVAVIAPELRMAFQNRFDCAVVDDDIETEARELGKTYKTPSLLFFREGQPIGAIAKVRDWSDYMDRITRILAAPAAPAVAE
ncbi:hydrogenase accessory protein [Roseibacterium beibuensis]|uniref:Hydrogenase expression/formation protein n=1 Tax=[Roseibacterium] beibuensis TaxID=1193142 RepID=A0ABP9KY26_9RHOB|nr:hydrogenase accessory protein [Roseibacterium beibuensis]MCS6622011.1 hydrogenase accessory protein [Roseibacterium beibuensis]